MDATLYSIRSDDLEDFLRNLRERQAEAYIAERMEEVHPKHRTKPAHGGLRIDLRILRRIFNYARQNRYYIADNPVQQPRLNYTSTVTLPFTDDELARMLADREVEEKPQLRAMILTLLYTGLRISDVTSLERSHIHFDTNRIERKTQKTGSLVSLPLHPELRAALSEHLGALANRPKDERDYRADRILAQRLRERGHWAKARKLDRQVAVAEARAESRLLFPTETGKYDHSLEAKLRRVWKRAGIQHAHAHRFRDTFAVKLLAQGASLYDVAKLLGNSVRIVEKHYSPYVKELQDRGGRLVNQLPAMPKPKANDQAGVIPFRSNVVGNGK